MQRRVQTDGSVIRRQLIDQGLPFRFTPLAGNRDVQLVLINRDRQGLQVAPALRADVIQGVEQRKRSFQLLRIRHRLFQ